MSQCSVPVLLVDANRDGLDLYSTALALAGIPSATAGSATEAIQRIRENRPRILVTELRLPGTTGSTLIQRVRRQAPSSELFIVGITANEQIDSREARQAGCDVVLGKPCLPDTLLNQLRRILS